jgi:hypothetical protein
MQAGRTSPTFRKTHCLLFKAEKDEGGRSSDTVVTYFQKAVT